MNQNDITSHSFTKALNFMNMKSPKKSEINSWILDFGTLGNFKVNFFPWKKVDNSVLPKFKYSLDISATLNTLFWSSFLPLLKLFCFFTYSDSIKRLKFKNFGTVMCKRRVIAGKLVLSLGYNYLFPSALSVIIICLLIFTNLLLPSLRSVLSAVYWFSPLSDTKVLSFILSIKISVYSLLGYRFPNKESIFFYSWVCEVWEGYGLLSFLYPMLVSLKDNGCPILYAFTPINSHP